MSKILLTTLLIILIISISSPVFAQETSTIKKISNKLVRGVINTITGWVEIPKNIYEIGSETGNPINGLLYGAQKGIGMSIVRTGTGLYDIVSFAFPWPEDYNTLIQPEFIYNEGD